MFKKELQLKTDQKLSGKDAKKFIAAVQTHYGDEASGLLGKKDLSLRKTGGGSVVTLYCNSEAGALFFEADGQVLPTLPALWKAPILPTLVVPVPVSCRCPSRESCLCPSRAVRRALMCRAPCRAPCSDVPCPDPENTGRG